MNQPTAAEALAKKRFLALALIRLSGIVLIMVGLACALDRIDIPSARLRKLPVSVAQGTSTAASAAIAAQERTDPAARASNQTGITVEAYAMTIAIRATLNPSGEPKTSRQKASSHAFRRCTPRVYSPIAHSEDGRFSVIH